MRFFNMLINTFLSKTFIFRVFLIHMLFAVSGNHVLAISITKAYMSIPKLKKLVKASWKNELNKYKHIINEAIHQEELHDDSCHVFYHAQTEAFRIYQDFIKEWYAFLHPDTQLQDFHFLRSWHDFPTTIDAHSFIENQEEGTPIKWNDNKPFLVKHMLSVNLSLFGSTENLGNFGECTFKYFFSNKSVKAPVIKNLFTELFDYFHFNKKYIEQLLPLNALIKTQEGTLYQIFVPYHLVDQIGFAAQRLGSPYRTPVILSDFNYSKQRHLHLTPLLYEYCNNPANIAHALDKIQGRLLFSQNALLNPNCGIKIIRYTTIKNENHAEYEKQLKKLTKHIFKQWLKQMVKNHTTPKPPLTAAMIKYLTSYYGI